MLAITKFLAGGVAIAALAGAAPAAAQYYPGYGSPYGTPGYGYIPYGGSPYGGYGVDRQVVVNQCANAVQSRLNGGYGLNYGYNPYGGYGGGYPGYGSGRGRVLGISRVEQGLAGGLTVRGVATSGRYGAYRQGTPDLVWRCKADFRGIIVDVDVNAAQPNYGYQYTPWSQDYSQYGYYRY